MCQPFLDHRANRRSSELTSNRSPRLRIRGRSPFFAWLLIGFCCLEAISNSARADGVVTNCSEPDLRAAMREGGTVTFACDGTITITNTIVVTNSVDLDASGREIAISGGDTVEVFAVAPDVQFTISNISVVHGGGVTARAGIGNGGTLKVINCTFSSNKVAPSGFGPAGGGAINSFGSLTVIGSTFTDNDGADVGGAIVSSFLQSSGPVAITNCTFYGNNSSSGSAIFNGPSGKAPVSVVNCTISHNTNSAVVNASASGGTVTLVNTIVANSSGSNCVGVVDGGHNISSDGSGNFTTPFSLNNTDPKLGPLADNGGSTLTLMPLPDSPAIDAADGSACPPTDQRGVPRPYWGACDIGALERTSLPKEVHFSAISYSVTENDTNVLINCIREGQQSGPAAVEFHTSAGTAIAGTDYIETNGILSFAAGETNKDFFVHILSDSVVDGTKTVILSLSNPTGDAAVGLGATATLNIVDNEAAPITVCDDSSLRQAVTSGGNITFGCDGTITLTNTIEVTNSLTLDGSGRSVVISGGHAVRLFSVRPGVTFTIKDLTLADGQVAGVEPPFNAQGGAIYCDNSTLNLYAVVFASNSVAGSDAQEPLVNAGSARGAAVFCVGGEVNLTGCTFSNNTATGGFFCSFSPSSGLAGDASGGAICIQSGALHATNTTFAMNQAFGGDCAWTYGIMGQGQGGAVSCEGGLMVLTNCVFLTNQSRSGKAGDSQNLTNPLAYKSGLGGAICVSGTGTVSRTAFTGNRAVGGVTFGHGTVGTGNGGAVYSTGQITFHDCAFAANEALGGSPVYRIYDPSRQDIGIGEGGAVCNLGQLTVDGSTFTGNTAKGGEGGLFQVATLFDGARAFGGAICNLSNTLSVANSTFYGNTSAGGDLPSGHPANAASGGDALGGGIYTGGGSVFLLNVTLANNLTIGGRGWSDIQTNGVGYGGDIANSGDQMILTNTLIAGAINMTNSFGTITDGGNNLSSDASCNFTASGSLNSTDPKLGPFGNYGGPTETIPLLSGSPAIDGADSAACPAIDQRGISRPYGAGCDIGAFESSPPYTVNGHIRGYLSPDGVWVNVGSNAVPVDTSGFYTFTGLAPGTYLVTPTAPETRFVPGSRVAQVGPDSTDLDFRAYHLNALTLENSTNDLFQFVFAGDIDGTYRTDMCTNLGSWSSYSTNQTDTNGVFTFSTPIGGSKSSYYRVVKP